MYVKFLINASAAPVHLHVLELAKIGTADHWLNAPSLLSKMQMPQWAMTRLSGVGTLSHAHIRFTDATIKGSCRHTQTARHHLPTMVAQVLLTLLYLRHIGLWTR